MRRTELNLFNQLGRRTRLLALAAMLIVVPAAPAVASAATASAASAPVTYSLAGTGTSVPAGICVDTCQPPAMNASVTATCSACLPGEPASGSFAISLVVHTFPPSPCKVKSVTGTLNVTWNNATTSSAAISGKFRDSNTLSLAGAFSSTGAAYPGDLATILLSNFPPNPCLAATNPVNGTLAVAAP